MFVNNKKVSFQPEDKIFQKLNLKNNLGTYNFETEFQKSQPFGHNHQIFFFGDCKVPSQYKGITGSAKIKCAFSSVRFGKD